MRVLCICCVFATCLKPRSYLPKAVLAVVIIDAMQSLLSWNDAKLMWTVRALSV